jgi:hypothetical protein
MDPTKGIRAQSQRAPDKMQVLLLEVLNNVFEIEKKLRRLREPNTITRNLSSIRSAFEQLHLSYEDPLGEVWDDTRSDCEASIAGSETDRLRIVEVIKPVVRHLSPSGITQIVQKGTVVVQSESSL